MVIMNDLEWLMFSYYMTKLYGYDRMTMYNA